MIDRHCTGHCHETQISGQQFLFCDSVCGVPLVPCAVIQCHAKSRLIHPFREPGAIQPIGTDGSGTAGSGRRHQLWSIPLAVPSRRTLPSPKVRHTSHQGQGASHQFLSFTAAVQVGQEEIQFCITDGRDTAVAGGAVHSHLQGIGHIEDGLTVGDIELVICGVHIYSEGIQNHGLIKGVDGTDDIFHCLHLWLLRV